MITLTPVSSKDLRAILNWIDSFICKPNAALGRPGVTCPFVPHLLQMGDLFMTFHYEIDGKNSRAVKALLCEYKEKFLNDSSLCEGSSTDRALLIVFPNIPAQRGGVVDEVHAQVKTEFVESGLMLGEFHRNSVAPGSRNPSFRASYAPLPLFVIRHMHLHDILFLREKESWFAAYYKHFGMQYESGRVSGKEFVDMFHEAKGRFMGT